MRILAVSDFYPPRAGGVERVVVESARHLVEAGVEVEVLTRRLERTVRASERLDGVPVWRLGPGPGPLPIEGAAVFCAARDWAADHLDRFDLVHAHLSFVVQGLLGPIGARARQLPLVATFYGPWQREYRRELESPDVPSRWPGPLRAVAVRATAPVLGAMQARVLAAARAIIALSVHSRRELEEDFAVPPAAVSLVPGGVDLTRFRPRDRQEARRRLGLPAAGPLLVAVRRLVPRMGLEGLIDGLALLAAEPPGANLAIAGEGPLRSALEERAARAGLADRVRFLGRIDDALLAWLYAAADLAVVPTVALEGFGLPVLEAFACGVPVVATPVGSLPELVTRLDPALVATAATPTALAAAIAAALAGRDPSWPERARAIAQSFSWDRVTRRLLEVYHRALVPPPRPGTGPPADRWPRPAPGGGGSAGAAT